MVDAENRVELKPCPFCGALDAHHQSDYGDESQFVCAACDARGPMKRSHDAARTAWNTRTPTEAGVDREAEREACAKVADASAKQCGEVASRFDWDSNNARAARARANEASIIAAAIRSRTPSTPTEMGVDREAVLARAETWLRECSSWLLTTDLDMQCPMETDPLDLADELRALKATPSTPTEMGEHVP